MKFRILFSAGLFSLLAVNAFAQDHGHSDIEFSYEGGELVIEPSGEITTEGILLFEGEIEELTELGGGLGAEDPGFEVPGSPPPTPDAAFLNIVDASQFSEVGLGYVNYYNPNTDMLELLGLPDQFRIIDNTDTNNDLILGGSSLSGDNPQFVGVADADGEIHDHVIFELLNEAEMPIGAYGFMFQMRTYLDFDPAMFNPDFVSEEFWIVLNYGLDEDIFEEFAVPAFGPPPTGAIPEPGAAALMLLGTCVFGLRRRSRSSWQGSSR